MNCKDACVTVDVDRQYLEKITLTYSTRAWRKQPSVLDDRVGSVGPSGGEPYCKGSLWGYNTVIFEFSLTSNSADLIAGRYIGIR